MLMDLKAPLNVGNSLPLTLVVQGKDSTREAVEILAPARPLAATM
jgi:copper(I)-binding protein